MSQLIALIKKDLHVTLSQRAVWFVLIGPGLFIAMLGLTPILFSNTVNVTIYIVNEDVGVNNINIGTNATILITNYFMNDKTVTIKTVNNISKTTLEENIVWFPKNFTEVALNTSVAIFYVRTTSSDTYTRQLLFALIPQLVDQAVKMTLLPKEQPRAQLEQLPVQTPTGIKVKDELEYERAYQASFSIGYAIFLLSIMLGSVGRIGGFTRDKNEDVLEIIVSMVKDKKVLLISKVITNLILTTITALSYVIGALIAVIGLKYSEIDTTTQGTNDGLSTLVFSQELLLSPKGLVIVATLFITTSLIVVISLLIQLWLPKETGERAESLIILVIAFFFFFSVISDPFTTTFILLINPLYWPYKICMTALFPDIFSPWTYLYGVLIIAFYVVSAIIASKLIMREQFILH